MLVGTVRENSAITIRAGLMSVRMRWLPDRAASGGHWRAGRKGSPAGGLPGECAGGAYCIITGVMASVV